MGMEIKVVDKEGEIDQQNEMLQIKIMISHDPDRLLS